MKKISLLLITAFLAGGMLLMAGCSDDLIDSLEGAIPADLRNTTWYKQIGQNTATLDFGTDGVTVSGTETQWDGYCRYGACGKGNGSCGNGYCGKGNGSCGFRNNDGTELSWEYTCTGNTLTIKNCNNSSFNGDWTKVE
ncbi:MAG: hypothetical protein LBH44_02920 [Treponema sp.]|nr:hypothetical protein [Treponema sp.]